MMLDTQINIFSVDTGNFYSNREAALHKLNHNLRVERNQLIKGGESKRLRHKSKVKIKGIENSNKIKLSNKRKSTNAKCC